MALVARNSNTWVNADGLVVKFNTDRAEEQFVGAKDFDLENILEIRIPWADLPSSGSTYIWSDEVSLPLGAYITHVEVDFSTDLDSTGGACVLSVGTIDTDDRTSHAVNASLVDAMTETESGTGGTDVAGWIGSYWQTVLSQAKLITVTVGGEAATAGEGLVRVHWRMPTSSTDTLIQ